MALLSQSAFTEVHFSHIKSFARSSCFQGFFFPFFFVFLFFYPVKQSLEYSHLVTSKNLLFKMHLYPKDTESTTNISRSVQPLRAVVTVCNFDFVI